jgi:hypothetical protein
MAKFFIPGLGNVTRDEFLAHRACQDYDTRLSFKKNPKNGQYAIFVKLERGNEWGVPEKPVLGFGYEVPNPDEVRAKIYNADTWRHGQRHLDEMDARNAARKKESEMIRDAAAGDSAERIEKVLRRDGKSPIIKSLRPKVKE